MNLLQIENLLLIDKIKLYKPVVHLENALQGCN